MFCISGELKIIRVVREEWIGSFAQPKHRKLASLPPPPAIVFPGTRFAKIASLPLPIHDPQTRPSRKRPMNQAAETPALAPALIGAGTGLEAAAVVLTVDCPRIAPKAPLKRLL
jgi:hypothetical protein